MTKHSVVCSSEVAAKSETTTDEQGVHEAKDAINAEAYAMPMSTKTKSKKSRSSTPRGSLEDDNASRCGRPRKFAGGAKPTAVTFLGPTPWRTSRYRTSELLARQIAQGISVNPLFSFPGFSAELILHRVLHSMDLGTTQDAIGNLFFDLVASQGGTQVVFNFLCVCVCACGRVSVCVCVCVRPCSACMSSRVLSPLQALGSSARSRGAA